MACQDRSLSILRDSSNCYSSSRKSSSGRPGRRSRAKADHKSESFPDYKVGSETILFVEDLESLRTLIADSLEQLGYRVLTAGSGEEALSVSAAYKHKIHLLLTDVMMPQMKGPELALKILADRPLIKVIYVSGYAAGIIAPHGVLEPGTVLVYKPFSIKILAAKLREVLDG
ncbi:MAG TPA: response regulator [Candidatus Angelobacter sp.]